MIKALTMNQKLQVITAGLLMSLFLFGLFNSNSHSGTKAQTPKEPAKTVKAQSSQRPRPVAKRELVPAPKKSVATQPAVKPAKSIKRKIASVEIPKTLPKKTVKTVQTRHTFSFDREIASTEKKVVLKKSRKNQGTRSSESSI